MESFLIYIGKVALAAGTFYLLYLALFQHQKHFVFNRIYLPVSLAASFIIPLITFTTVNYIAPVQSLVNNSFAFLPEASKTTETAFIYQWYHYLTALYALGVFGFFIHLLIGHLKAINIVRFSQLKELFGAQINVSEKDVHPFSFFSKIVISEKTLSNPDLNVIVEHELIHVKERHTLDILFAEILFLFQWFNPFAWLIKDAMRNNLEYLTDNQITKNNNAEAYQLAMVGLAHKKGVAPFLNALNGSQLKNRIIMMKKKTENKYALLKQLVVLPLLAVLVMGLSTKEVKTEIVQAEKEVKIVVDGNEIPSSHPALASINFTKGFDGGKVTKALGVEDKVVSNTLAIDENSEDATYYLQTSDYVLGTNPEFEKMTSTINEKKVNAEPNKSLNEIEIKKATVKGQVTNEKGEAIPAATVIIKGTTTGTITDMQGNFILQSESNIETLMIAMLGYKTAELEVNKKSEINVTLEAEGNSKDNTIKVVGYGKADTNKMPEDLKITGESENPPMYVVDGKETDDIKNIEPDGIESISVLKDESATSIYGDKGKNGVVIITTKEAAKKKLGNALVIVDGKKYEGNVDDIDPENIKSVNVLKNESATEMYGPKAKDGAIVIKLKDSPNFGGNDPLIIVDGVKSDKDVNDIDPEDIASISVLKDASAIAYDPTAKNGVILITTKSAAVEITSELELRKFIAQKIKYPLRPRKDNIESTTEVYIKVLNDGTINYVSSENVKDAVHIGEIVVTAYKPEEKATTDKLEGYDKYFRTEVKRVLYQLTKIDIDEYKGKTIAITTKFALQEKN